jgi:uncharacterized protein YbcI
MASTHTEPSLGGSKAAAIAAHVVHTMNAYTGRGPSKARTYINDDVVTVVLKDTLTKGERSLITANRHQLVLTMRKAFEATMRHDLISGIEDILERTVVALMSDSHFDPDIAVEVFLLAPADAGPSRSATVAGAARHPARRIAGTSI